MPLPPGERFMPISIESGLSVFEVECSQVGNRRSSEQTGRRGGHRLRFQEAKVIFGSLAEMSFSSDRSVAREKAQSCNCLPHLPDMRLADALVWLVIYMDVLW